jgi:transmembrane protein 70, mitochondrial
LSAQKLQASATVHLQRLNAVKSFSSTASRNDAASGGSSTQDEEKIYSGALTSQIKVLKIFSLTTSAIGLGVQPLVFTKFLAQYGSGATVGIFSALAFFTAVTPILIHYIAKKYIAELYYDKSLQTYKAITYSFFLGRVEVRMQIWLCI